MKKLTLILSIFLMYLFLVATIIAAPDNLYKEKLKFIKQVLDKPDEFENLLKSSSFFDEEVYGAKFYAFRRFKYEVYDFIIKSKSKLILTYSCNDDEDKFNCAFLGGANEEPFSIHFPFQFKNGKWRLNEISIMNNYYLYSTKEDAEQAALNNNRNQESINFKNQKYFNQDYKTAEKLDFVSKLIHFPDDVESLIRNSEFNPGDLYSDSSFRNNLTILKNNLAEFKDSCRIWLNYPFPFNDIHIEKYLNSDQLKDYFVIEYARQNPSKRRPEYLTIEFEQNNSKWYISKITKGTLVYISFDGYNYMKPTANIQDK